MIMEGDGRWVMVVDACTEKWWKRGVFPQFGGTLMEILDNVTKDKGTKFSYFLVI